MTYKMLDRKKQLFMQFINLFLSQIFCMYNADKYTQNGSKQSLANVVKQNPTTVCFDQFKIENALLLLFKNIYSG